MSLDVGRYRLFSAQKTVEQRWDLAKMAWQDTVRQEFADELWAGLEPAVLSTLAAIDRLAQVLGKLRRDCGE